MSIKLFKNPSKITSNLHSNHICSGDASVLGYIILICHQYKWHNNIFILGKVLHVQRSFFFFLAMLVSWFSAQQYVSAGSEIYQICNYSMDCCENGLLQKLYNLLLTKWILITLMTPWTIHPAPSLGQNFKLSDALLHD